MFKVTYWNSDISILHKYGNISKDTQPEFFGGGKVSKMKQVDFAAIKTTEPWVWIFLLKMFFFCLIKFKVHQVQSILTAGPPAGVNLQVWSYLLISDDADPAASTLLCTFSSRTSCGCGDVEIFWLFCFVLTADLSPLWTSWEGPQVINSWNPVSTGDNERDITLVVHFHFAGPQNTPRGHLHSECTLLVDSINSEVD